MEGASQRPNNNIMSSFPKVELMVACRAMQLLNMYISVPNPGECT